MNKPVAWMDENENVIFEKNWAYPIPLYTHPVINNGGNLEELNTKVQDASTSLESTPPINAEPVAWISEYTLKNCLEGNLTDEVRATTTVTTNCTIPLYTHPVELTDEEILKPAEPMFVRIEYDEPDDIHICYEFSPEELLDFARAILRKAQEK